MSIEMNKYLTQLPKPKVLVFIDGADMAFPEFYDYCVKAWYIYTLGFRDVTGMVFRVALESLLKAYIVSYCCETVSDGDMLGKIIDEKLPKLGFDEKVLCIARHNKSVGNKCIHGNYIPDAVEIDKCWSQLVAVYRYIADDVLNRRISEHISVLVEQLNAALELSVEQSSMALVALADALLENLASLPSMVCDIGGEA